MVLTREGPVEKVVVPLDQSPLSERALPIAQAIARHEHAAVELITVVPPEDRATAAGYLDDLVPLLTDVETTAGVVLAQRGQSVAERLLEVSQPGPHTLVCMTSHGRSGLGATLLGSTAEDVLRRSAEPVLLVGRDCGLPWPGHRRSVLVPIDGSRLDDPIVEPAIEVVRRSGLEPVLLHVAHDETARAPSALESLRRRVAESGLDPKVDNSFGRNAARAIVDAAVAWGAALIVMASYVRPGAPRAFLGSVTMATIHRAPCPVLVYPGTALRSQDG
jgi:nucleotide-binding universal stress UspA family protein